MMVDCTNWVIYICYSYDDWLYLLLFMDVIATMVDCLCWNDESNMLVAIGNGKLLVWYYPNVVFVDKEIMSKTTFEKEAR